MEGDKANEREGEGCKGTAGTTRGEETREGEEIEEENEDEKGEEINDEEDKGEVTCAAGFYTIK